jgi:WD40 repeat protein
LELARCAKAHGKEDPFPVAITIVPKRGRRVDIVHFRFAIVLLIGLIFSSEPQLALAGVLAEIVHAVSLYDRPVLVVDAGPHMAPISAIDTDREGRFLVSASYDKTIKIWATNDGKLLRTIRLPAGPGHIGEAWAVAVSPDGTLIAAGGWTGDVTGQESVYLFDRESGGLVRRVSGLPNVVWRLAFSPDGNRIAAALGGSSGVRLIDSKDGRVVAADEGYGGESFGVAFDARGRLATTSFDGKIRLYDSGLHLLSVVEAPSGKRPYRVSFSPDGARIAINYYDLVAIDVLGVTDEGRITLLERLLTPDSGKLDSRNLSSVSWSADGSTIYAAGNWGIDSVIYLRRWLEGGKKATDDIPVGKESVTGLSGLPGGRIALATEGPMLGVLEASGVPNWKVAPSKIDTRKERGILGVSPNGAEVRFTYGDDKSAVFSATKLSLDSSGVVQDFEIARTQASGLVVDGWKDGSRLSLNGSRLTLSTYEIARSLAVTPDDKNFALGTDSALHFFDTDGRELWKQPSSSPAWALTVSGDGRLIVAAYGDGTIRWHRLADGATLLSFLPLADRKNWVAWTPEGFYEATPDAHNVIKWQVNYGQDTAPYSVPLDELAKTHRPDVIRLVLQEMDTVRAIGVADLAEARMAVQAKNRSAVPPGAQLHVVAVGVSQYQDARIRLRYADKDASDIASALLNTQKSLYANVRMQVLVNEQATRLGILKALDAARTNMILGDGEDLAVVVFSGQSATVENDTYLLPYDADVTNNTSIEFSGISTEELRRELLRLGKVGRVLVLLDACHSGGFAESKPDAFLGAPANSNVLEALANSNVSVMTSSREAELSREDASWGHGAFTQALLEGLSGRSSREGLVTVDELAAYISKEVPALTHGMQHPEFSINYGGDLFAAGR